MNSIVVSPSSMARISARSGYLLTVCTAFLSAGIVATVLTKWADLQHAPDANGAIASFEHPVFQTFVMFCGETICLAAFTMLVWRKRRAGQELMIGEDYSGPIHHVWFAVPALADFAASTTCNIALTMTSASVYQMLRGSTVLFIALFSYFFLHRRFFKHEYLGLLIVISGLVVVGVSASLRKTSQEASNPVLGNILVVVGQIIQAAQFVLEEAWIKKYRIPPLLIVGWEGVFGAAVTASALALFQAFDGKPDDVVVALQQISNCWQCALATALVLFACAFLNAAGNTMTKEFSAASRMVLDTLRNIFVWSVAMIFASTFNESFDWIQMVGFFCLILGGVVYRRILPIPLAFFDVAAGHVAEGESQPDTSAWSQQANYATLEGQEYLECDRSVSVNDAEMDPVNMAAGPNPSLLQSNDRSLHENM